MEYNVTEIRSNLALSGAQLEVFRAQSHDSGDPAQERLFADIITAITAAGDFLSELEECYDDDFDD